MITETEKTRYLRQLLLDDFGEEAQEKLKKSTVFIVGAGGLGSPVSYYLAAAGVGKLIICDRDTVELSNLNRQILHLNTDIDLPKSASAGNKLKSLNPDIEIVTHYISVDKTVLEDLAGESDIIVDCLDNIPTRLMINEYCIEHKKPLLHAGIDSWTGQLTLIHPPDTPCLNCIFDNFIEVHKPKPVLGAVAGIMGTTQALAIIKYLVGLDTGMMNKLQYFDAFTMQWYSLPIEKNDMCKVCN